MNSSIEVTDNFRATVFGEHDENTLNQLVTSSMPEDCVGSAIMADGHLGYSMPIGGVIAYENHISPSGVGYDIGCGNMAVRTALNIEALGEDEIAQVMQAISDNLEFGIGKHTYDSESAALPLFDRDIYPIWDFPEVNKLKQRAASQLDTIGSGNHYVDLLIDENLDIWVANHFGSRGLGHSIATGFLNLAQGRGWYDKGPAERMDDPPTLIAVDSELGQHYLASMTLAGDYARKGREYVISKVLNILGTHAEEEVHVHHNYAWRELLPDGETNAWVVRKGATPLIKGQPAFIGGSMGDVSAIVQVNPNLPYLSDNSADMYVKSLFSAPHGAGRIMSRTKAAGKWKRVKNEQGKKIRVRSGEGAISPEMMNEATKGVYVIGGGLDEAPQAYRSLREVLSHHTYIQVDHWLTPIGVVMASDDVIDPYKD